MRKNIFKNEIFFWVYLFYNQKFDLQLKKVEKTQNHDLFISPKWKKNILELALKSLDISKLDRQMSKR